MRQFCNFLLAVILGVSVYLMAFEGFTAPEIPTLGDALLRFLAALCLQLLTQTPVYLLECLPEASAALLVKKGLNL